MYQLNPFTRLVGGLISNELYELDVRCTDSEFAVFQAPPDQTCGEWGQAFVDKAGGYLNNPNARSDCQYCTYSTGAEFYEPLGIYYSNRGREIGIMIAFIGEFESQIEEKGKGNPQRERGRGVYPCRRSAAHPFPLAFLSASHSLQLYRSDGRC